MVYFKIWRYILVVKFPHTTVCVEEKSSNGKFFFGKMCWVCAKKMIYSVLLPVANHSWSIWTCSPRSFWTLWTPDFYAIWNHATCNVCSRQKLSWAWLGQEIFSQIQQLNFFGIYAKHYFFNYGIKLQVCCNVCTCMYTWIYVYIHADVHVNMYMNIRVDVHVCTC